MQRQKELGVWWGWCLAVSPICWDPGPPPLLFSISSLVPWFAPFMGLRAISSSFVFLFYQGASCPRAQAARLLRACRPAEHRVLAEGRKEPAQGQLSALVKEPHPKPASEFKEAVHAPRAGAAQNSPRKEPARRAMGTRGRVRKRDTVP